MPVLTKPSAGVQASIPPPQSILLDSAGFKQLWDTFRDQANKVASSPCESTEYQNKVAGLLETLQKLIFGLDEGKKVIAVKNGALELIVKLSETFPESDAITLRALKATKCCVVKNPVGRTYCRSAGTLNWMSTILQAIISQKDPLKATLVEEGLTTLAAICLGDDLNALQGAKEFRNLIDIASKAYPKESNHSLSQKITYLGALFDAMDKEQEQLIVKHDIATLFETVREAELMLMQEISTDGETEIAYGDALSKLEDFGKDTNLLDALRCDLYERRSAMLFALKKWEECVCDVECCVAKFELSQERTLCLHTRRVQALRSLGRLPEAREALGKALLMNPKSQDLQELLEHLAI